MSELSEQELQHAYEQITSGNVDAMRGLHAADYGFFELEGAGGGTRRSA